MFIEIKFVLFRKQRSNVNINYRFSLWKFISQDKALYNHNILFVTIFSISRYFPLSKKPKVELETVVISSDFSLALDR